MVRYAATVAELRTNFSNGQKVEDDHYVDGAVELKDPFEVMYVTVKFTDPEQHHCAVGVIIVDDSGQESEPSNLASFQFTRAIITPTTTTTSTDATTMTSRSIEVPINPPFESFSTQVKVIVAVCSSILGAAFIVGVVLVICCARRRRRLTRNYLDGLNDPIYDSICGPPQPSNYDSNMEAAAGTDNDAMAPNEDSLHMNEFPDGRNFNQHNPFAASGTYARELPSGQTNKFEVIEISESPPALPEKKGDCRHIRDGRLQKKDGNYGQRRNPPQPQEQGCSTPTDHDDLVHCDLEHTDMVHCDLGHGNLEHGCLAHDDLELGGLVHYDNDNNLAHGHYVPDSGQQFQERYPPSRLPPPPLNKGRVPLPVAGRPRQAAILRSQSKPLTTVQEYSMMPAMDTHYTSIDDISKHVTLCEQFTDAQFNDALDADDPYLTRNPYGPHDRESGVYTNVLIEHSPQGNHGFHPTNPGTTQPILPSATTTKGATPSISAPLAMPTTAALTTPDDVVIDPFPGPWSLTYHNVVQPIQSDDIENPSARSNHHIGADLPPDPQTFEEWKDPIMPQMFARGGAFSYLPQGAELKK